MKRYFTILEGSSKGTRKAFTEDLMIVGRSRNADLQIEDSLVSRIHLEVRVDGAAVFVENKSTHGSFLNGKPLVGVVSLNAGDMLEIGHTKLGYEEDSAEAAPAKAPDHDEALSAEMDGTRIADSDLDMVQGVDREVESDGTRELASDGTRMMEESDLPKWVEQNKQAKAAASKGGMTGVLVVLFLLALGGLYWSYTVRRDRQAAASSTLKYRDSLYSFSMDIPLNWSKLADESGRIIYGLGAGGGPDWARLTIYTDKDAENALTGLADGFVRFQKILKQRHEGMKLIGSKRYNIHGVIGMDYAIQTPAEQGLGFYVLNAESRIVIECTSAGATYQQNESKLIAILQSFRMPEETPQQYIDFPLPDRDAVQLALSDPAELSRQVDGHIKLGETYIAGRDVKPDNLYQAVHEFRQALKLANSPPERLPQYHAAAEELLNATNEFNQAIAKQRFEIIRATRSGDNDTAYWEATKMMQMVPDKTDAAYQYAVQAVKALRRPAD
jgi:hypothetical protein